MLRPGTQRTGVRALLPVRFEQRSLVPGRAATTYYSLPFLQPRRHPRHDAPFRVAKHQHQTIRQRHILRGNPQLVCP